MFNQKEFRKALIKELEETGHKVKEVTSMKNNGEKEGIVLQSSQSPYSPLFYLTPCTSSICRGTQSCLLFR